MTINFIRLRSLLSLGPRSFKARATVALAGSAWMGCVHQGAGGRGREDASELRWPLSVRNF